MEAGKKIYFASDFHLGVPTYEQSLEREKLLVQWLDEISHDAEEIYLVGDVFDFWYEYKRAIPRGFVRFLGKIAELTDAGIPVHWFTGNHDMWIFDYIPKEVGAQLYRKPLTKELNGKKFFIAHGDGLGPGDRGYKFLKKVFSNRVCQWLFARIHPNTGIGMANFWSGRSRKVKRKDLPEYLGDDKEWLVIFSKEQLKKEHYDYFIYGHRHTPIIVDLPNNSHYVNLGDWINHFSYAVFDGEKLEMKKYNSK